MEVHICMRHQAIKCNFLKSSATSDDGHDFMRIYPCAPPEENGFPGDTLAAILSIWFVSLKKKK